MNKSIRTIPKEVQYIYYAICELVGIPTANDLLDSGQLLKWISNNPVPKDGAKDEQL